MTNAWRVAERLICEGGTPLFQKLAMSKKQKNRPHGRQRQTRTSQATQPTKQVLRSE
ncbi:unnamed protein product [Haemonchus placei]|uniref:Transposase n=1 Tax=Haemonchus placei TaxID=6290 RepID=A0A0N4WW65_HAEPC|nr:unnamed protein product [Haemonchus placei]